MIVTDLSKQKALDADPKAIQQINFTGNFDRAAGATIFHKDLWKHWNLFFFHVILI